MITARTPSFAAALRGQLRGEVRESEALSRYSTYRIGGPATVALPATAEDVATTLKFAHDAGVPWFVVGLGSNLLFPDAGLDALVIRPGKGLDQLMSEGDLWTLGAGLPQPLAAKRTAAAGWGGVHKMVGVPGSVGGGIVMNAGCHGAEWQDTVVSVHVVGEDGVDRIIPASEAGFAYRRSALGKVMVLSATVKLHAASAAELEEETEALYKWRREGTPFNQPCCGSVFKNPPVVESAVPRPKTSGQYIEATGLKELRIGGAQVSPMHANYFINVDGATAADVVELMRQVRQRVEERWGVRLEPEVKLIDAMGGVGTMNDE